MEHDLLVPIPDHVRDMLYRDHALALESQLFYQRIKPTELVSIVAERAPRVRSGRQRALALAEDRIGAHQSQPAFQVGSVLLEALGEAFNHPAHHGGTILRRHLLRRRDIFGAWALGARSWGARSWGANSWGASLSARSCRPVNARER